VPQHLAGDEGGAACEQQGSDDQDHALDVHGFNLS
jgi:hypothetical protein